MIGLNSAVGYIRKALAKSVNLRNTPEIRFILDESIEYGVSMSSLIDQVLSRDEQAGREDQAEQEELPEEQSEQ